ncbi:MAG: type II toxin-antitoxin system mRNA interferase toxin, RelE/StbE family [Deferribacteraceae bacterium]|jgi:addiction module RelE/StbE family toxin|nr:type II toxin-antitoxin system mRNA interferase toxin, RelE/StbE family [Deferribacteraceae bacterium]
MSFQLSYTKRFEKHYRTLSEQEKKQVKHKIELLANDPIHPSLRTKRIQGTDDLFECSVNMDIRIIWHYEGDTIIVLMDIGHHDILREF